MNADRLLGLYERIADAPDAVGRLRRFVLDLAVRGKLVPQDPADEPASELLKRIAKEKARLVKAGEISKQTIEPLEPDEAPFLLPPKWVWARVGEICAKTGSGSTPRGGHTAYLNAGVPFLRSHLQNSTPIVHEILSDMTTPDRIDVISPDFHSPRRRAIVFRRDGQIGSVLARRFTGKVSELPLK